MELASDRRPIETNALFGHVPPEMYGADWTGDLVAEQLIAVFKNISPDLPIYSPQKGVPFARRRPRAHCRSTANHGATRRSSAPAMGADAGEGRVDPVLLPRERPETIHLLLLAQAHAREDGGSIERGTGDVELYR